MAVPRVAGQSINDARSVLKQAGFDSKLAAGQSAEPNSVVERTEPAEGTRHARSKLPIIDLVLRAKPPQRRMPSIIGQTCVQARAMLERDKLVLRRCDIGGYTGQVGADTIHTQSPAANAPLDGDTRAVDVLVEPLTVRVPDVIGMPAPQAVQRLTESRLRARSALQPQPWHRVVAQSPRANVPVKPGAEVAIDLVYTVPDLRGLGCDEARERVRRAGMRALDCRVETTPTLTGDTGRIQRQLPAANSTAREPVLVQAFTPLVRTRVPRLVGLNEEVAQGQLRSARLASRVAGPAAALGRVVASQSPEPDTLVEPGATVDMRLALTVPDLRSATCDAARALAQRHGFDNFECRRRVTTPARALGLAFEQSPPARTVLAAAQPVDATVAQGITVPKVTGLAPAAAITTLGGAGLAGRADVSNINDGDRIVVRQQPQAGEEVVPATTVTLTTQRMTQVPDVVGRTLDEALNAIAGRDLRARADAITAPSMRRVRAQQPDANTRVAVGQAVVLTTVLEAMVPSVIDQPLDDARAAVERAGLRVQVDASARPGVKVVRGQTPTAGARVEAGSGVALRAVSQVQVPDVVAPQLDCAAAQAAARGAGLQAHACHVEGRFGLRLGTAVVQQQSLAAGTTVDEDTLLTLNARTPLAPVVVLGTGLASLFAAGIFLLAKPWRVPSPLPPPLPPPTLHIRIVADNAPQLVIRAPHDSGDDSDGDDSTTFGRALRLRVDTVPPRATIRAWHAPDRDDTNPT